MPIGRCNLVIFTTFHHKNSVLLRSIISYTPTRPVITGYVFRRKAVPLHPNWHDVMYASSHKKKKEAKKKI